MESRLKSDTEEKVFRLINIQDDLIELVVSDAGGVIHKTIAQVYADGDVWAYVGSMRKSGLALNVSEH